MKKPTKSKTQTIKVKRVEDMTPKQQAFVREVPKCDFNLTQAAINAKYAKGSAQQTGSRLMLNAVIQKEVAREVERRNRAVEKKSDVGVSWVIEKLKTTVERCMQITPVMVKVGDKWEESGEFTFMFQGSNAALKMIGDHLGMWKTQIDFSGKIDINHLDDVPTDMLLAVMQMISESGQKQITLDTEGRLIE
jgi:hypothetical protein